MGVDLARYRAENPEYYGNASLADVAADLHERSGSAASGVPLDQFAKQHGFDGQLAAAGQPKQQPQQGYGLPGFWEDTKLAGKVIGQGLYSAAVDVLPKTAAEVLRGGDVPLHPEETAAGRMIAEQQKDLERWNLPPEQAERDLFGIVKAKDVQAGLQNLGYSAGSMVAGGLAGGAAGSVIPGAGNLAGVVAGSVGAGLAGGAVGYRATKDQFVEDIRQRMLKADPNLSEERWADAKKAIESDAQLYGMWEAVPEAVGSALTWGIIKTPVGKIVENVPFIKNGIARAAASAGVKLGMDLPVELGTETWTQHEQGAIEAKQGLRENAPTWGEAFGEIGPQTAVTTLATLGLGHAAEHVMPGARAARRDAKTVVEAVQAGGHRDLSDADLNQVYAQADTLFKEHPSIGLRDALLELNAEQRRRQGDTRGFPLNDFLADDDAARAAAAQQVEQPQDATVPLPEDAAAPAGPDRGAELTALSKSQLNDLAAALGIAKPGRVKRDELVASVLQAEEQARRWNEPEAVAARYRESHAAPFPGQVDGFLDGVAPVAPPQQTPAAAPEPGQATVDRAAELSGLAYSELRNMASSLGVEKPGRLRRDALVPAIVAAEEQARKFYDPANLEARYQEGHAAPFPGQIDGFLDGVTPVGQPQPAEGRASRQRQPKAVVEQQPAPAASVTDEIPLVEVGAAPETVQAAEPAAQQEPRPALVEQSPAGVLPTGEVPLLAVGEKPAGDVAGQVRDVAGYPSVDTGQPQADIQGAQAAPAAEDLKARSKKELNALATTLGIERPVAIRRDDLVGRIEQARQAAGQDVAGQARDVAGYPPVDTGQPQADIQGAQAAPAAEDLKARSKKELNALATSLGIERPVAIRRDDLVGRIEQARQAAAGPGQEQPGAVGAPQTAKVWSGDTLREVPVVEHEGVKTINVMGQGMPPRYAVLNALAGSDEHQISQYSGNTPAEAVAAARRPPEPPHPMNAATRGQALQALTPDQQNALGKALGVKPGRKSRLGFLEAIFDTPELKLRAAYDAVVGEAEQPAKVGKAEGVAAGEVQGGVQDQAAVLPGDAGAAIEPSPAVEQNESSAAESRPEEAAGAATPEPSEKIGLALGEKIGGSRKDTAAPTGPRVRLPGKDDSVPAWKKRFVAVQVSETGFRSGEDKTYWSIADQKGTLRTGRFKFDSKEEAEAAIPLAAVSLKHRVTKRGDAWEIYRKVTDRKTVVIKDGFATEEDAKRYMAEHAEDILNTKTGFGEEILARPEKVFRKGAPRREGPAKGQDFLDAFGFRGVEFGEWNDQAERQEVLNHAYDGLLDLAEILNIPPKALSLNGDLALAFGSRGRGLSSAKAHYERDYGVINLTKLTGAGSLAHEWYHALDHYLGRQDTKASSEKVENKRGDQVFAASDAPSRDYLSHGASRKSQVREALRGAYEKLLGDIAYKAEQYKEDTEKAEQFVRRARGYLERSLKDIRAGLAEEAQWGRKRAPATAEQLARFDALAEQLLSGDNLALEMRSNEAGGRQRSRFGSYRSSNDILDGLAAIYKEVRGRSGFNAERTGPFNSLAANVQDFARRAKMLEDARSKTEKTKQIPTEYRRAAYLMDQGRTSDYWSEPHELAARAFSSYVEDRVAQDGGRSDFLVYGANNAMLEYRLFNVRPFPEGAEREAINAAFDKFFQTVKTKETGRGVAMFSRSGEFSAVSSSTDGTVAPVFYSQMQRVLEMPGMLPKSAPAEKMLAAIEKHVGKFKGVELEESGLKSWLSGLQERLVTRQDVLDEIATRQIDVVEVVKDVSPEDKTIEDAMRRRAEYIIDTPDWIDRYFPGVDPAYFDVLSREEKIEGLLESDVLASQVSGGNGKTQYSNYQSPGGNKYKELLLTLPDGAYATEHWDEEGVLAHIRFNERVDHDGKRVLHIEEIQSDWHQEGKRKGYRGEETVNEIQTKSGPAWEIRNANGDAIGFGDTREEALADADQNRGTAVDTGVPDAPFKNTSSWAMLAMKRMIRYAAEKGFDRVSWTPGEMQAARYDLSKQLDRVEYEAVYDEDSGNPTGEYEFIAYDRTGIEVVHEDEIPLSRIEELAGKEVADKIQRDEGRPTNRSPYRDWKALSGLDLKVGGEGMRGFYDQILPKEVAKYIKQFGGKVETARLPGVYEVVQGTDGSQWFVSDFSQGGQDGRDVAGPFGTEAKAQQALQELRGPEVWSFDLTDAMKRTAMKGQPLYRRGNGPTPPVSSPIARAVAAELRRGVAQFPALRGIVDVYQSEADMPADLREAVEDAGVSGRFHGAYDAETKRIALVAGNIPTVKAGQAAFVQTLLRHEGRHAGLDRVLGGSQEREEYMRKAAQAMPREVSRWLTRHGLDSTRQTRAEAAEEILVSWAKDGTVHRALDRLLSKIAAWVRSIFPTLELTRAELRQLLAQADDFVDGKGLDFIAPLGQPLNVAPAFSRGEGASWAQQVDDFLGNRFHPHERLDLGGTPPVIGLLGGHDLPLQMTQSKANKILKGADAGGKHGVSPEVLKQLPQALERPVVVLKSATWADSLVLVTELPHQGSFLVAAVHLNVREGRAEINEVASVHARGTQPQWVSNQIRDGGLLYRDKTKVPGWQRSFGLQLPTEMPTRDKRKIFTEVDLVKYEQGLPQKGSGPRFARTGDLAGVPEEKRDVATWLKDEASANVRSILAGVHGLSETGVLGKMVRSPEYWQHPVLKRLYETFRGRTDRAHELLHQAFDLGDGRTINQEAKVVLKDQKQRDILNEGVDYADVNEVGPEAMETWFAEHGANEATIGLWRTMRERYDMLLDERLASYRKLIDKARSGYERKIVRRLIDAGIPADAAKAFDAAGYNTDKTLADELAPYADEVKGVVAAARKAGVTIKGQLSDVKLHDENGTAFSFAEMVEKMGQLRGFYAPRLREAGDYVVRGQRTAADGTVERFRAHKEWRKSAEKLRTTMARDGWDMEPVGKLDKLPEATQGLIKTLELAKTVESAVNQVGEDVDAGLVGEILENLADEVKARGFRSQSIRRSGRHGDVVQGYFKDAVERFARYAGSTAYGLAKMEAAEKAAKVLFGTAETPGLDIKKERDTYRLAVDYLAENLRNAESGDRVFALAKSVASLKYLGLNPKSALVNLSSMATSVPAALHAYAMQGKGGWARVGREIARSMVDYLGRMTGKWGRFTADEQQLLDEIRRESLDDPQFAREALSVYRDTAGRGWSWLMGKSMLLFGATEQLNRGATLLAGYRLARAGGAGGAGHATAVARAREASDRAHGVYDRATQPTWTWGTGAGARVGQAWYVYKKYGHNYLQLVHELFARKDWQAATFALAAPAVLGGLGGHVLTSLAKALVAAGGGDDDPERWVYDFLVKNLGGGAEDLARFGLLGLATGADLSGSLGTMIDMPDTWTDVLGPVGGMAKDVLSAVGYLAGGQPGRAAEKALPSGVSKFLQAVRESNQGVTTGKNYPVIGEDGKPLRPTAGESVAKALGFRPLREARARDRTSEAITEERRFGDRRDRLYARFRAFALDGGRDAGERQALVEAVADYNQDVAEAGLAGRVAPITRESLLRQTERLSRPTKREQARLGGQTVAAPVVDAVDAGDIEGLSHPYYELRRTYLDAKGRYDALRDAGDMKGAMAVRSEMRLPRLRALVGRVQSIHADMAELRRLRLNDVVKARRMEILREREKREMDRAARVWGALAANGE